MCPGSGPASRSTASDLGPQRLPGGKEGRRIQVPLHRHVGPQNGPGPGEGEPPVDPHDVGPDDAGVFQEGRSLVGEVDQGKTQVFQPFDGPPHGRQGETPELVGAEEPCPGVEDHESLGPGFGLGPKVGRHGVGQLVQQELSPASGSAKRKDLALMKVLDP